MKRLTGKYENGTAYYNIVPGESTIERLAAIEDILGDDYELDRLRELVELYKNVPHICDCCIGCEIEPTDGHGCDGYDNFVFSVRRIVAALKAREQE